MATNDFLPFAGGAGANVLTQADYAALAARDPGFGSGILLSDNLNKVLRQGTVMAAVLAQWIADNSGDNVVDDGTTASIEASLTKALQLLGLRASSTAQTGVVQLATSAEAQALADASKVLTPATLAAAFQGSNQSATGYQKFPGGLILQWGTTPVTAAANTLYTASLPVTFPTNGRAIVALFSNYLSPSSFVNFNMNFNPAAGSGPASQYRYSSSVASAQAFYLAIGN